MRNEDQRRKPFERITNSASGAPISEAEYQELELEVAAIEAAYARPDRWWVLYLQARQSWQRLAWTCLVLLAFPGPAAFGQSYRLEAREEAGWLLVKSEGDVTVYRRPVEGRTIDEIRILASFNVARPTLMRLLGRVDRYPEWVYKCEEAELVSRVDEHDFIYYTAIQLPWPVSDRDVVLHSVQWTDEETGDIMSHSTDVASKYPAVSDHERMAAFDSLWRITDRGAHLTYIDYTVQTDPGGTLPKWLVNLAVASGPLQSMIALKMLVETPSPR